MDEKAMSAYRGLLLEIKYRTETISEVMARRIPLRAKVAEELCYLQLRLICETLAIGCLIIHGNLKPKPELFKKYQADWLMRELEKLHPRFFPVALESEDDTSSAPPVWRHKEGGYLTSSGLMDLWRLCGSKLHRGSAKSIFKEKSEPNFNAIHKWHQEIIALLNRHIIHSPDEKYICYFVMQEKITGEVASNFFERIK